MYEAKNLSIVTIIIHRSGKHVTSLTPNLSPALASAFFNAFLLWLCKVLEWGSMVA